MTTGYTWDASDADHPARTAAKNSQSRVAARDKEGWLALFADDAHIEDPVGPSFLDPAGGGHRGKEAISAFWDGYVGMMRSFHAHTTESFANGPSCANLTRITTTLADDSTMTVDCVIIYTVNPNGLLTSLRAHWEPDRALATLTTP
ncbi:nuclear transport factor 2 family protein [Actinocorallia sp. API 0066]|uniref:nuclear transport factor 2 family protein n=1 Tax=Actinocorallia sp. API 0066 TaxID=2896846 RepID=UPI001E56F1B3|nr:nuclear transport factor 2 family protein [Actinocorallia sp. API 0066]MCD0451583.1 nuclear transport factor 2 family protein [Actinocorallia sp. API 0066]